MSPKLSRNTEIITSSLPPEMAQNLRQVVRKENRVSDLLREAIHLYREEREWCRWERLRSRRTKRSGRGRMRDG